MREIKFRFWSEEEKRMSPCNMADVKNIQAAFVFKMGILKLEHGPKGAFLQYTGLKDKNGKEIYEGDIVRSNMEHDAGMVYKIHFYAAAFWLWVPEYDQGRAFHNDCDRIEVVGNIHQNPELLKK